MALFRKPRGLHTVLPCYCRIFKIPWTAHTSNEAINLPCWLHILYILSREGRKWIGRKTVYVSNIRQCTSLVLENLFRSIRNSWNISCVKKTCWQPTSEIRRDTEIKRNRIARSSRVFSILCFSNSENNTFHIPNSDNDKSNTRLISLVWNWRKRM